MQTYNQNNDIGDRLLYSSWVKYDKLKSLINEYYTGTNYNELNIYIDLSSIVGSMYRSYNGKQMFSDPYIFSSRIINMVAHYREFFQNKYKVSTKFFIINSNLNLELYRKFYPLYDDKSSSYLNKENNSLISVLNTNIELLKLLCPFIPDVQFIETRYEVGVRIIEIAKKEASYTRSYTPSIIITKDLYNIQLVDCQELEGVTDILILRPKKIAGEDASFIISKNNVINEYIKLRKNNPIINNISPKMMSLIMAITRVPERNIKNMINVPKAINTINNMVLNGDILNSRNSDIIYFGDKFNSYGSSINPYELYMRFKSIDLQFQNSIYETNPEITEYCGIVDLYNPEEVKNINQKYYSKCPLDLNVL